MLPYFLLREYFFGYKSLLWIGAGGNGVAILFTRFVYTELWFVLGRDQLEGSFGNSPGILILYLSAPRE